MSPINKLKSKKIPMMYLTIRSPLSEWYLEIIRKYGHNGIDRCYVYFLKK